MNAIVLYRLCLRFDFELALTVSTKIDSVGMLPYGITMVGHGSTMQSACDTHDAFFAFGQYEIALGRSKNLSG